MSDSLHPDQPLAGDAQATPSDLTDPTDPGLVARVDMPVMGSEGRTLGRVAALERDATTSRLTGIIVRHGWLGAAYTSVPTEAVSGISQGLMGLSLSKSAFRALPECDAPRRRLSTTLTWER